MVHQYNILTMAANKTDRKKRNYCSTCRFFDHEDVEGHGWCTHNDVPEESCNVCAYHLKRKENEKIQDC